MGKIFAFLEGKKTYIAAIVAAVIGIAQSQGYVIPEWVLTLLGAFGLYAVRAAVARLG